MLLSASLQMIFAVSKSCCLVEKREKGRSENSFQKSVARKMAPSKPKPTLTCFWKITAYAVWGWVVSRTLGGEVAPHSGDHPASYVIPPQYPFASAGKIPPLPTLGGSEISPAFSLLTPPFSPPPRSFWSISKIDRLLFFAFRVRKFW